ncbi:MAG: delta-aminolevulinic acid dehydratase [Candidatus Syntrophoarchaeum caldarius]|uniref:Delta-aminolevulinic acid dehydratase n=1 Tax=Candidatus Syntropharchaeum caldarium TaxID=1838285 RepID=A0A1F2P9J4_9EURY|nr:MAG: delta-aminolevulinic acid dehydratase [Candidatus Syntrophoarchaeum caldarius]
MFPITRMRRTRASPLIRDMIREAVLSPRDLIYPIFVDETITRKREIGSMPGQFRLPPDGVVNEIDELCDLGIPAVLLFGIPETKDAAGTSALDEEGVIQRTIEAIRDALGDRLVIITDVCLCEYTTHGHCGIVEGEKILNDPTLEKIAGMALSHARAGADIVAPSGMMDGMVSSIRGILDENGYQDTLIMSYAAKYASSFYAPFRDAADSSYTFGDRSSYQMDPGNADEAIREVELDILEGADIVMVKPALSYLDLVYRIRSTFGMPTAVYSVSGEYSMVKAAAMQGWIDETKVMYEMHLSMKRAGADMIITYAAKDIARYLEELR